MPTLDRPTTPATRKPVTTSSLSQQDLLAAMLRRYFSLPENAPIGRFQKGIEEITKLELLLGDSIASKILDTTARQFYAETKSCPFCGTKNQLHLLAAPAAPAA